MHSGHCGVDPGHNCIENEVRKLEIKKVINAVDYYTSDATLSELEELKETLKTTMTRKITAKKTLDIENDAIKLMEDINNRIQEEVKKIKTLDNPEGVLEVYNMVIRWHSSWLAAHIKLMLSRFDSNDLEK